MCSCVLDYLVATWLSACQTKAEQNNKETRLPNALRNLAGVQSVSWVAVVVLIAVAQYLLSSSSITQTEPTGLQSLFSRGCKLYVTCT
jgi:hypothetical protein